MLSWKGSFRVYKHTFPGAIVRTIDSNGFFAHIPLSGLEEFDLTNKLIIDITIPADRTFQYYQTYKVLVWSILFCVLNSFATRLCYAMSTHMPL